jgi:thioredoxin reductase (NADPH)
VLLISRGEWSTAHPAIQAMALGRIDSYLFNPWRPAERLLYLPVGEFLADWESARPAERVALTIVGGRSDPRSSALRSRCARGALPFTFLLADSPAGQQVLADAGLDGSVLPVVAFFTGQVMADPSDAELADWLGFSTSPSADAYDVAVIGAGPAGLTAGMYAASEGLRTLILDGELPGGQASTSSLIRNYLGFPRGLTGADLANRALEQAWLFGADVVAAQQVTALDVRGDDRVIRLASGVSATASAVVVASGVSWRRLGIPELEALRGAGVFYGAAGGEAQVVADQDVPPAAAAGDQRAGGVRRRRCPAPVGEAGGVRGGRGRDGDPARARLPQRTAVTPS